MQLDVLRGAARPVGGGRDGDDRAAASSAASASARRSGMSHSVPRPSESDLTRRG